MSVVVETIVVVETVSVVAPPVGIAIVVGVGVLALGAALVSSFSSSNNTEAQTKSSTTTTQTEKTSQQTTQKPKDASATNKTVKRIKVQEVDDPSSEQVEKTESTAASIVSVWQHIVNRFERFFRFGGIINRISALTENQIGRFEIVGNGRSEVQDGSSGLGRNIHAAHVIRTGTRNSRLRQINASLYNFLGNFIGHTQNVPRWANDWNALGGDIDRYQSKFQDAVIGIVYRGSLSTGEEQVVKEMKKAFLKILDDWIEKVKENVPKKLELEKAKKKIEDMTPEELFEKGKKGRNGDYDQAYM